MSARGKSHGGGGVGIAEALAALRSAALGKPGAFEDHPWGHVAFKAANKKIFLYASGENGALSFGCKLPHSGEAALTLFGFCEPMGYGLAKSGWVTASFEKGAQVPVQILLEWLDESYAAVAGARAAKAAQASGAQVDAAASGMKARGTTTMNRGTSAAAKPARRETKGEDKKRAARPAQREAGGKKPAPRR